MADVAYLLVLVAFFAVAALYVKACEAILGPDRIAPAEDPGIEPAAQAA